MIKNRQRLRLRWLGRLRFTGPRVGQALRAQELKRVRSLADGAIKADKTMSKGTTNIALPFRTCSDPSSTFIWTWGPRDHANFNSSLGAFRAQRAEVTPVSQTKKYTPQPWHPQSVTLAHGHRATRERYISHHRLEVEKSPHAACVEIWVCTVGTSDPQSRKSGFLCWWCILIVFLGRAKIPTEKANL